MIPFNDSILFNDLGKGCRFLSTVAATAYGNRAQWHPAFSRQTRQKAQKSSGFRASGTYLHCIKDNVLIDAACGSGAFLVKSMCNMMKEAGEINTHKASVIRNTQLYGIEFDREIYALACANMLIHKDGKTNLEQLDSRSQEACDWIKAKK